MEIVSFRNTFADLADYAQRMAAKVIRDTAREIARDAAANAPFDTGALRESIHVVDDEGSDYPAMVASVASLRQEAEVFSEVRPSRPYEAIVAVGVKYGAALEYGTAHSGAQPYFEPAVEAARPGFEEKLAQALSL